MHNAIAEHEMTHGPGLVVFALGELARLHGGVPVGQSIEVTHEAPDFVRTGVYGHAFSNGNAARCDAVVAFLEGRTDWAHDAFGRNLMPNVDLDAFRVRHEDGLRASLAARLSEDRCVESMGYCTWYVRNYPEDPVSDDLQAAMKDEWYRRGHPRWRGVRFANCAYRCAKDCRQSAEPLDDACYAPCFARCEAAVED